MRLVSLVPSVTETLAALGVASSVVAVTDYCVHGVPDDAVRLGGTKNPDIDAVVGLRPDLVVTNTEENRPDDIAALRAAGLEVHETYPRTVADVTDFIGDLAGRIGVGAAAELLLADLDAAMAEVAQRGVPSPRIVAVTLIWRRPWRGVGPDTYIDDLLWRCGFANALSGFTEQYPKLDPAFLLGADVVLLPSEPYAFSQADREAVAELLGADVHQRFVDGTLLTWHGPRTATALRTFSSLAAELASELS